MPKKVAVVDYAKCHPERCDHGVCEAILVCEFGHLIQESPYEAPDINPAKWCHSCAECVKACRMKAIRMM